MFKAELLMISPAPTISHNHSYIHKLETTSAEKPKSFLSLLTEIISVQIPKAFSIHSVFS